MNYNNTIAELQVLCARQDRLYQFNARPLTLDDLIEWVRFQSKRGRATPVKVTPSRNKREGRYCGNHPILFANPRHQRMGRREYYDVFVDARINAYGNAALRK